MPRLPDVLTRAPEIGVVACAVRAGDDADFMRDGLREAERHGLNWEKLLSLSLSQGVYPTLYRSLRVLPADRVRSGAMERLQAWDEINMRQTLRLAGELLCILDVLDEAGIPAVPLKGVTFAEQYYGDVAARKAGDLDVLIPKKAVPTAVARLRDEGFRPPAYQPPLRAYLEAHEGYHYMMQRRPCTASTTAVELHWALMSEFYGFAVSNPRLKTSHVSSRLRTAVLQGREVLMPSAGDYLLFLCAHAARHGWSYLFHLEDVHRLILREEGLEASFLEDGSSRVWNVDVVRPTLYLLGRLFDTPLPAHAARDVDQFMERRPGVRRLFERLERQFGVVVGPERLRYWQLYPALLESPRDRIRLLGRQIRAIVVPGATDREAHKLPERWRFLNPVTHLGRLLGTLGSYVYESLADRLRRSREG